MHGIPRAQDLLVYQEAYETVNGAASEFNGACGYSSEDDIRVEHDRQSVALALHYGRHETDSNHATTWWRTYWKDSEPHEAHATKMHQPFRKEIADVPRRRQFSSHGKYLLTVLGVTYRRPSNRLLANHVASRRRFRHRLRVVPDLLLFAGARCGRRGEWGLTSRMWAPMLWAQNPREGMAQ